MGAKLISCLQVVVTYHSLNMQYLSERDFYTRYMRIKTVHIEINQLLAGRLLPQELALNQISMRETCKNVGYSIIGTRKNIHKSVSWGVHVPRWGGSTLHLRSHLQPGSTPSVMFVEVLSVEASTNATCTQRRGPNSESATVTLVMVSAAARPNKLSATKYLLPKLPQCWRKDPIQHK